VLQSVKNPNITWGHDSVVWNNLVFKSLKHGYLTEINEEEKKAVLDLLQLLNPSDPNFNSLKQEFDAIVMLDAFFFKILAVLHEKYKDENTCIDSMLGQKSNTPPHWGNFNKFQVEQHLKQIEGFE